MNEKCVERTQIKRIDKEYAFSLADWYAVLFVKNTIILFVFFNLIHTIEQQPQPHRL